ncbi:hypothetical protein [Natronorubrum tibetense]|uniref:hypothetical protein n=1 Tax=Natronorubrum tibetense TaxID=63128 RepID=UPI000AAC1B3F|nr:hypothetical protein [Natronorubrum tibetense]
MCSSLASSPSRSLRPFLSSMLLQQRIHWRRFLRRRLVEEALDALEFEDELGTEGTASI